MKLGGSKREGEEGKRGEQRPGRLRGVVVAASGISIGRNVRKRIRRND